MVWASRKASSSLPVRLAPGNRFDLAPIAALAGPIGRIAAFAHHAFEAPLLGHAQQRYPVIE